MDTNPKYPKSRYGGINGNLSGKWRALLNLRGNATQTFVQVSGLDDEVQAARASDLLRVWRALDRGTDPLELDSLNFAPRLYASHFAALRQFKEPSLCRDYIKDLRDEGKLKDQKRQRGAASASAAQPAAEQMRGGFGTARKRQRPATAAEPPASPAQQTPTAAPPPPASGGPALAGAAGEVVGRRCTVHWKLDNKWFSGKITGYDPERGLHAVLFDDGDFFWLSFTEEEVRLVPGSGARGKRVPEHGVDDFATQFAEVKAIVEAVPGLDAVAAAAFLGGFVAVPDAAAVQHRELGAYAAAGRHDLVRAWVTQAVQCSALC